MMHKRMRWSQLLAIACVASENLVVSQFDFCEYCGMSRIGRALLVGFVTFIVAFVALMGYAMIRFAYFSGSIPFAPYAVPIPLVIGVLAGAIVFQRTSSN